MVGIGEPKYLNSPETTLFHKGRELYGLFENRRGIQQAGRAVVVEGYMDVGMLAQYGVENALATRGTALLSVEERGPPLRHALGRVESRHPASRVPDCG